MIDLSSEFHPIPKVFRPKKTPKSPRKIGKKGKESLLAVEFLKSECRRLGITQCEARFEGCWVQNALSFAHYDKRRFLTPPELKIAILICIPCHTIIERWSREKMKAFVLKILAKRKT